jgi:hypothetical protein
MNSVKAVKAKYSKLKNDSGKHPMELKIIIQSLLMFISLMIRNSQLILVKTMEIIILNH